MLFHGYRCQNSATRPLVDSAFAAPTSSSDRLRTGYVKEEPEIK